jgi:drug/metabolite transporter (DMT)-like permease
MVGAALFFTAMALCAKLATGLGLPGPEVACLRFLFGLLVVAGVVLLGRPMRPRNLRALFLRGAFGGGAVLLYFLAIAHLPVGVATLLNYSSPIFTVLFSSLFLAERLTLSRAVAIALALCGVALVAQAEQPAGSSGSPNSPDSIEAAEASLRWVYMALGLLSAALSGAAVTTIRAMRPSEGAWEIFFVFCLVGVALTAPPTLHAWVTPRGVAWLALLGVGASSVGGQLLMTHALRDLPATTAALLLQITPVATFAAGVALFGERPSALGLAGAALTLLGVTWGVRAR